VNFQRQRDGRGQQLVRHGAAAVDGVLCGGPQEAEAAPVPTEAATKRRQGGWAHAQEALPQTQLDFSEQLQGGGGLRHVHRTPHAAASPIAPARRPRARTRKKSRRMPCLWLRRTQQNPYRYRHQ